MRTIKNEPTFASLFTQKRIANFYRIVKSGGEAKNDVEKKRAMEYIVFVKKNDLAERLLFLSDKYESESFLQDDPSRFLRRYKDPKEAELLAFVAAQLSFGQREQFIAKIEEMLDNVGAGSFSEWLTGGGYKKFFPKSDKKFYRFFSLADMKALCGRLAQIVQENGSLGNAVRAAYECFNSQEFGGQTQIDGRAKNASARLSLQKRRGAGRGDYGLADNSSFADSCAAPIGLKKRCGSALGISGFAKIPCELRLVTALISLFPEIKCVSQNPKGACKKLHMFLRWMVRQGSPVDLGLWTWASAADLLVPLDTHVLQEAARLGLIAPDSAASAKTAIELTKKMAAVFPGDPARADFALFGLGVDAQNAARRTPV